MKKLKETKVGLIVLCNAKFKYNKKEYKIKDFIFKNKGDMMYYRSHKLKPLNIHMPVKLYDVEVISEHGYESKATGHHEVKKSEEIRNKITGSYD